MQGAAKRMRRSWPSGSRMTLLASAVVLGGLAMYGGLDWKSAAAGFVVIMAANLIYSLFRGRAHANDRPVNDAPVDVRPLREAVAAEILDELPDPIFVIGAGGRLIMRNEAAIPLLGRDAVGKPLAAVLRNASLIAVIDEVWRTGEARELDYRQPGPVEREFHVHVTSLSLPAKAGDGADNARPSLPGPTVLVRLHDRTDARRLEAMRVDFVANASHELRTPLASLSGFIDTLRGHARNDPDAQERFLKIMADQAGRMRRLIEDLLSLSRIELKEHVRPVGIVDMARLTLDCMAALEPIAASYGVKIEIMPGSLPDGQALVRGERDELAQVIQNLTDNALRYGCGGERVEVSLASVMKGPRAMICLSVHDFGPGIAPEHLPRLTERFYRADPTLSRASGGTGLGLAIVKHIVNRHEGVLGIESTPGESTTFSVLLPAMERVDAREAEASLAFPEPASSF